MRLSQRNVPSTIRGVTDAIYKLMRAMTDVVHSTGMSKYN